jgi:cellulose synthase/poly-beta-1,6-N-acetylglucosamine synthase-like glycosyltransferase
MLAVEIIFWLCILFVAHSYVFFPLILKVLAVSKKQNNTIYPFTDELPDVHIMMSVYNAAAVLEQKLESMLATSYPLHKIHIWIGSDHSTDHTIDIIEKFSQQYPNIHYSSYQERRGKSQVLNDLYNTIQENKPANNAILLLTDASVFFTKGTIYELVKHFKNEKIGLVGANIIPPNYTKEGISFQEKAYADI